MAIAGQLTVAPEALAVQSANVSTLASDLRNSFDRMQTLITETENYWKGEAAEAHRRGYKTNQSTLEEIIARYQEHVRDLEEMAGVYREAETAAKNLAEELPASIL